MTIAAGVDVGTGAVKVVLCNIEDGQVTWLGRHLDRIRNRDLKQLAADGYEAVLGEAGLGRADVIYVATTGEGERIDFCTGRFYSMTTHARGAIHLQPRAHTVLDAGALHSRAVSIDERGNVLDYKMTCRCASGSGQFLENIARYLGVAQDEIGPLSVRSDEPEQVSSICAVLAETDVINMVSRGITSPNILKSIHLSMAVRLCKLLKAVRTADGVVLMTGGLALDTGLVAALNETMEEQKIKLAVETHPKSIYAGAMGAALWGAFRHEKLVRLGQLPVAS